MRISLRHDRACTFGGSEPALIMRTWVVGLIVIAGCSGSRHNSTPSDDTGVRWRGTIEIASGGGERGPWRQNDSDYDYVDDPSVALDAAGDTIVAWVDQRSKDVYLQRFGPHGRRQFVAPTNVSRSPDVFSWLPRIAVSGDDVFVVWQEIVFSGGSHGGEAFFARSRDGGATFEAPTNLSRTKAGVGKGRINADVWNNGSFDLALGFDDHIYVAWTEYEGALSFVRSVDRGATFSAPQQLHAGEPPARAPALATDRDGTVYLAWTLGEQRAADLRLAVSTDHGRSFGAPRVISRSNSYSDAPKLAVDGEGTLHVVYAESRGGPFDAFHIRHTRSRDRGQTFEGSRALSTPAPPRSTAFPMLALDGDRVVVSWELYESHRELPRGLALTYSSDGGSTFAEPRVIDATVDRDGGYNGSHQGRLMRKLAVRDGHVVVANSALAHGERSRVWLVRGELPPRQLATR
jgi:hypothetical protein